MGQYYKSIVLKNDWENKRLPIRAALLPIDFDNGAKLMEHSYVGNDYVRAFIHLIDKLDEDKSGVPCVWCGDYADTHDTKGMPVIERINPSSLKKEIVGGLQTYYEANGWIYKHTSSDKSDEYNDTLKLISDFKNHDYKYVINHTKKEYVEIPEDDDSTFVIHPLPILISDGCGRGSGDYNDEFCVNPKADVDKQVFKRKHNAKFIGAWAYDTLSVTNDITDTVGYNKIDWENEYEIYP